jgi:hypothetical protein
MQLQKKILILIISGIMLVNPVVTATINAQGIQSYNSKIIDGNKISSSYPGWDLERKFAILYDPQSPLLMDIAIQVFDSTSIVYHNTHFIPIKDWDELSMAIDSDEYWIKMYFVSSTMDGITLGSTKNWTTIANLLLAVDSSTHHIFGTGSTNLLNQSLSLLTKNRLIPFPSNIHFDGTEVIDAELSYFYYLWEIGEILAYDHDKRYQSVAEDFRTLGIQYFGENLLLGKKT